LPCLSCAITEVNGSTEPDFNLTHGGTAIRQPARHCNYAHRRPPIREANALE
jgi:hypothetical protein